MPAAVALNKARREARWIERVAASIRACPTCGAPFIPIKTTDGRKRTFCGAQCQRVHAAKARGKQLAGIPVGGTRMQSALANLARAKRESAWIARQFAKLERSAPFTKLFPCKACRRLIPSMSGRKYCGECSDREKEKREKDYARAYRRFQRAAGLRDNRHYKRARRFGVAYQNGITAKRVAERDKFRCGVCGGKVVPSNGGWHPEGWSVGHIVALSQGGTHTWDNVQCEHAGCNGGKGTRAQGQPSLF